MLVLRDVIRKNPLFADRSRPASQQRIMPEVAALFDFAAPDRLWKMPEERFLHAVLMVANAANEGFQAKVETCPLGSGLSLRPVVCLVIRVAGRSLPRFPCTPWLHDF